MQPAIYQLAEINIGKIRAPIDHPLMSGFSSELDRINRLADTSEGFVWRLQTEAGNATSISIHDDPLIIINMSVWQSVEALHQYVYRSEHTGFLRQRKEWFEPFDGPFMALWWVKEGHRPTPQEGKERLAHLAQYGPTPQVFTFKTIFSPTDA